MSQFVCEGKPQINGGCSAGKSSVALKGSG